MNVKLKCPVCKSEMPNAICGKCGYTRFLFPREIPPQIEKFEQTRIRIMQGARKKTSKDTSKEVRETPENRKGIIGTLMIRTILTEGIQAYPIYEGRNIYGSKPSDNIIRTFIDPLLIGTDIPKTIFAIEGDKHGLKLIPHNDFELSHNHYLIKEIIELDNDDYFFHSNLLSFNAVLFHNIL